MRIYPYPPSELRPEGGFTAAEVRLGHIGLRTDVECTECGKEQSAANAGSMTDGRCIRCGGRTA